MTLHNQEPAATLSPRVSLNPRDVYNIAVQLHNHEFRTLGERASLILIAQSILLSAFVYVLVGEGTLHYLFPYVLSAIAFVGAVFCVLLHEAGRNGSRSAFAWKQYMRAIEAGGKLKPWDWYYMHYRDIESSRTPHDRDLLKKLPLPFAWLAVPGVFSGVWFLASLYVPIRWIFDDSFALDSCRVGVIVFSAFVVAGVTAVFLWILYRSWKWWYKWQL